jgi:rod shape-determining protein MreC
VGGLVALALVLVTISFREDGSGPLADAQSAAASALRPLQVAADRVAEPFRDAYAWGEGLAHARTDAKRLQRENEVLRQQYVRARLAEQENARLRSLLRFRSGPRFPEGFEGVAAEVIYRPPGAYAQAIVVAAGRDDGIRVDDPVVTAQGLVGTVSRVGSRTARVTLLTDDQSAVSATVLGTEAAGIVRLGQGPRAPLRLVRVPKEAVVKVGDTVVTAGWRSRRFSSLYPQGILIGRVTSVGRADTDLFTQVQLEPFADLSSLEAVLVLVPSDRAAGTP